MLQLTPRLRPCLPPRYESAHTPSEPRASTSERSPKQSTPLVQGESTESKTDPVHLPPPVKYEEIQREAYSACRGALCQTICNSFRIAPPVVFQKSCMILCVIVLRTFMSIRTFLVLRDQQSNGKRRNAKPS
jgi:hypothetical protein